MCFSDFPAPAPAAPTPAAMLLLSDDKGFDDKMPSFRSKALVVLRVVEAKVVVANFDAWLLAVLLP